MSPYMKYLPRCPKNNGEKLLPRSQQGSFLHEHAHQDLINGTRPVTATVVHGIGTKFFAIKSFLEIQMVAGTLKEWIITISGRLASRYQLE